jgi:hypothetical protein
MWCSVSLVRVSICASTAWRAIFAAFKVDSIYGLWIIIRSWHSTNSWCHDGWLFYLSILDQRPIPVSLARY